MVLFIRSLLLLSVVGGMVSAPELSADEPRRRAPEAELFYGAVAFSDGPLSDPILSRVNTETLTEVRLEQISARIEEIAQRQVVIDEMALTDLKIDTGHRVTWLKGETIYQLLDRIHNPDGHGLTWEIDEQILRLTTDERSRERYTTQRYFVGDLLTEEFQVEEIMQIIEYQTSGPWHNDEPGTGTITQLGNHLYIRQTPKVQSEIVGVLRALRSDKPIVLMYVSEEELRLLRILEERIVSFDWPEITLQEFCKRLGEMTGVLIRVDIQAIQDAGLDNPTLISARARELPLRRALEIQLENVHGTALMLWIEDEAIIITTGEKANEAYATMILNVTSLGITGDRLDQFAELIQNETSGPWDRDEPGTGGISIIPGRNALIIRQTRSVQHQILQILADLRTLPRDQPLFPVPFTNPVTRYYSLVPETAKVLATLITETIEPDTWEIEETPEERASASSDQQPAQQGKPAAERHKTGRILVIPIPHPVQEIQVLSEVNAQFGPAPKYLPDTKKLLTEGGTSATCYLAITHTPEVHLRVEKLLKKLLGSDQSRLQRQGGGFFRIQQ